MRPFFSIITPLKNGEKFIPIYTQSLLNQTFKNWEAIIVEDNSTDNSYEKMLLCRKQDFRFNIFKISQTKKKVDGPYLARNEALSHAKGEYILFLDIDDYWLPEKLHRYKTIIRNKKIDFILSRYVRLDFQKQKFSIKVTNFWFFKYFIKVYNPIPNCTVCIKKELIKNIIFKPINHEDWQFWIEIIEKNKDLSFFVDSRINTFYILHKDSISSSKLKAVKWIIKIYKIQNLNNLFIFLFILIRSTIFCLNLIIDKVVHLNFKIFAPNQFNRIKKLINLFITKSKK
tara:strand:- start:284 stop:1141 length:858 start_codon:yes stop_codon:yes gene_type:complete